MGITIKDLNVEDLRPNPDNPRKRMDDVADLAASIRTQGVKQPLLVTPTGQPDIDGRTQYRVVIGHRRLAAAKQAGLDTVRRSWRKWTHAANGRSCSSRTRNAPT